MRGGRGPRPIQAPYQPDLHGHSAQPRRTQGSLNRQIIVRSRNHKAGLTDKTVLNLVELARNWQRPPRANRPGDNVPTNRKHSGAPLHSLRTQVAVKLRNVTCASPSLRALVWNPFATTLTYRQAVEHRIPDCCGKRQYSHVQTAAWEAIPRPIRKD